MMAAKEYAGEVDASPMTIELTKPIAPGLRVASGCAPSDCVAMMPPGRAPTGRWVMRADRRGGAHHRPQSFSSRAVIPVGAHTVTQPTHLRQSVWLSVKFPAKGCVHASVACRCGWSGWVDRADRGASGILRGDGGG